MLLRLLAISAILTIASMGLYAALPAAQVGPPRVEQSQQEKEMQERQIKEMNKKRQQDIRDDTVRLYQLATELKAAVDKTDENTISVEVVRKADEVEKLAKKVKDKMKESIGPSPRTVPAPMPTPHF